MTAGESHGQAVLAIIDGLPAGLKVSQEDIDRDLRRRQSGYGRGGRMKVERDQARVISGIRGGQTLGSPIGIVIENLDWANWKDRMDPWRPSALEDPETAPRPGHADLAGAQKFGHRDMRNVLERASARETAARVAVGALARVFLARLGVEVGSRVTAIGEVEMAVGAGPEENLQEWKLAVEESSVRCSCPEASRMMVRAIDRAQEEGYSLGGVIEVRSNHLPPGLGSYTQADLRLDARLAGGLMSIPGIKAVEIGAGFGVAGEPGSRAHDEIYLSQGRVTRDTNRAGGLEGGMTNGEPLVLRLAMKPIATQAHPLKTVDVLSGKPVRAFRERADVCAVPAAGVVAEAVVSLFLAQAALEKFGQDSMEDILAALAVYRRRAGDLPWRT